MMSIQVCTLMPHILPRCIIGPLQLPLIINLNCNAKKYSFIYVQCKRDDANHTDLISESYIAYILMS